MISNRFIMLFLLVFSLFYLSMGFTACSGIASAAGVEGTDGIDGSDGTGGEDGLPGPTIYLMDDSGTRYYSGSSVYLGKTQSAENTIDSVSVIKTFRIVNDSGGDLRLNNTSGNYIEFDSYELLMFNNDPINWFYETEQSTYNYFDLDESGLNNNPVPPNEESPDFTFTIEPIVNNVNKFHFRRKYLIPMLLDGEALGFALELSGFISTYNGSSAFVSW